MKLIHSRSPDVIVIGAGLAGLVVASELQRSGVCVQVFDKSGDLGGRLATRRRSEGRWDHGAPCVEASSEAFRKLLESLREAGSATLTGEPAGALTRYSGAPDMRALLQPLRERLAMKFDHEIQGLTATTQGWEVRGQVRGKAFVDQAPALVCTAPGPQSARLLVAENEAAGAPGACVLRELRSRLSAVRYSPCWTALLRFEQPVALSSPYADAVIDRVRPWSMHEQGRTRHWLVQANSQWSQTHLEASAADVAEQLLEAWRQHDGSADGQAAGLQSLRAHRWRYARCSEPLDGECWWDPALRLGLAGDWFVEPDAQGAFASAQTLVETMTGSWLGADAVAIAQ
jgi:predicted NAD/FAD-dependent oxidoreductase